VSAILSDFHMLRPWWLLALLALPLLWHALGRGSGVARVWAQAIDAHLLPHLLVGTERSLRLPRLLVASAWTLATLALAGPAWERLPRPLYRNQAARVIALELSPSMLAPDLKPDRLSRARYKIRDLLQRLGDGQVAMLAYAGDSFVVAPLTEDVNTVDALLDALDPSTMPVQGNATDIVIQRAEALIKQAGQDTGDVLLIADSVSDNAASAAAVAHQHGITVSVLGVGTAQGAPVSVPGGGFLKDRTGNIVIPKLDASVLRDVAASGGGRYVEMATDARDLDLLLGTPVAAKASKSEESTANSQAWRDRGPWLLFALIPLALMGFRRGWLAAFALFFVLPVPARAFEWSDLWQRPDQRAWEDLQTKKPEEAAKIARDPALRGAANYRAGDYDAAAQNFAGINDADADYNRGNALAQSKQYEEALKAYDAALSKNPDHADARSNRDSVAQWLKKQQQKKDDQNQQGKDQQGDQKQDSQNSPQDQKGQQDQKNSGQSGQQDQKDQSGEDKRGQEQKQDQSGDSDSKDHAGHDAKSKDDKSDSAQQAQQREEAQRKEMERALQQAQAAKPDKDSKDGEKKQVPVQEAKETEEQREQRQSMEQWLQRVPDDPGGLLRRKFQLEYERRQRAGKGDQ
jgi:Ca-activated chloride channel family protein